jgi:hypothetical protein
LGHIDHRDCRWAQPWSGASDGSPHRSVSTSRAVGAPGGSTSFAKASARRTCGSSAIVTRPHCRDQRSLIQPRLVNRDRGVPKTHPAVRRPLGRLSRPETTRGRSPGVSSIAFGAQPPDLRLAPLMDMDFAIRCPLVRRSRLVSGSCSSARTFASRFQRTFS